MLERPQAQGATQRVVVYTNRAADPDAYYRMGWWMNELLAADGDYTTHRFVSAPLGGGGTNKDGRQAGFTGTATYVGSAVGLYSLRPRTKDAMRAGSFTATADLTANFDDNKVEGSITKFRDEKGAAISGWVVNLDLTDIAATTTSGVTSGVGAEGLGWTGTFTHEFTDETSVNTGAPKNAYGTFTARVGSSVPNTGAYSSVKGAYATNKTE